MTTNKLFQVTARDVYGKTTFYPHNDAAKIMCEMVGTKTVTPAIFKGARALGYAVDVVQPDSAWLEQLMGAA